MINLKGSGHAGHNPDGMCACGTVGLIKESTEARKVMKYIKKYFKTFGITIYNDTVNNGTSQQDVLKKIVNNIFSHTNKLGILTIDFVFSIHFNDGVIDIKGNKKNTGVEVWIKNDNSFNYAYNICKSISSLGFKNRGVKKSDNLYILNSVKNKPCFLIECCFVNDKDDIELYNPKTMASKIVEGIINTLADDKKFLGVTKKKNVKIRMKPSLKNKYILSKYKKKHTKFYFDSVIGKKSKFYAYNEKTKEYVVLSNVEVNL